MKPFNVGVMVVTLWLAGALQLGLAPWMAIHSIAPDFVLVAMGCLCLFTSQSGATVIGFFSGLIYGGVSLSALGPHIVSRTLIGFFVGWLNTLEIQPTAFVASLSAMVVTLGARLIFFFMAPPAAHELGAYLQAPIGGLIYNAILAAPTFLLLSRILIGNKRRYR